ncbi:unnamed protein product [Amoebophrya sp. A25]|nr:unnamed protein product [Amoebophrya sp. A25]|eukprot:GSA25T00011671001.1
MRRMSVTSEGFFGGKPPKASYSQTRQQSTVSLPKLPVESKTRGGQGNGRGWRNSSGLPLPKQTRNLMGREMDFLGGNNEDSEGSHLETLYNQQQQARERMSQLQPPFETDQATAEAEQGSANSAPPLVGSTVGVSGPNVSQSAGGNIPNNSNSATGNSVSSTGAQQAGPQAGWNNTALQLPPAGQLSSKPAARDKGLATTFTAGFGLSHRHESMSVEDVHEQSFDQEGDVTALRNDNQRLKQELEQLQIGLLQSLKRQDRFISGGQFKGPLQKNRDDKNKLSSTHQGSFLGDKEAPQQSRPVRSSNFHVAELKRYKAKTQELTRELGEVRKEQLELGDAKGRVRALEEEGRILKDQIRQLKEDQALALEGILNEHEHEMNRLREQVREDKELGPVYQEMAQVVAARDGLASELETSRREAASLRDTFKVAEQKAVSRVHDLESALNQAQNEKAELEHSLDRWKKKLSEATRRLRDLEQESERELEHRDKQHAKGLSQVQADHDIATRTLQAEIAELKELIAKLKEQLNRAQQDEKHHAEAVGQAKEEWETERIALEQQWKLDLQTAESKHLEEIGAKEKEFTKTLEEKEIAAQDTEKALQQRVKTLQTENQERVKKLFDMALSHFLQSAQQKNKGVEAKVVFAVWRSVTRESAASKRESERERQGKDQLEAVRKQAEREQQQLRLAVEEEKKHRDKIDKMKDEERKKQLAEKLSETARNERSKVAKEHESHAKEQERVQASLKERNGELENIIRDMQTRMELMEKNALQRKLQQSMKLQVLAPRVSVTINGDTVNMLDVEAAPSSEELRGIMHREVLPRFAKILLSEDFDEGNTQERVQAVMSDMVRVIENKLQGIFGANCLRTTSSMG